MNYLDLFGLRSFEMGVVELLVTHMSTGWRLISYDLMLVPDEAVTIMIV